LIGFETIHDEDQPRAANLIRPGAKMLRRVDEMLHAMHSHRIGLVDNRENPLDPKDARAVSVDEHRQPDSESGPVQRLVDNERERSNPGVNVFRL
jgi:hypothetical protein